MLKFFIIYSLIVTAAYIFTVWLFVRKNKSGSEQLRRAGEELQASRDTVTRVSNGLGKCRDILSSSESGLEGCIKRLREIAKEVEYLEDVVNSNGTN